MQTKGNCSLFVSVQVLCEKYWPLDRGTVYHGLIQVTTVTRKQGPDYFITTISLRQVREKYTFPFGSCKLLLLNFVCPDRTSNPSKKTCVVWFQ